jgi:hypothetical protein
MSAERRQREMVRRLGAKFFNTEELVPLGRHSSFATYDMAFAMWCDARICDFAWVAVAHQLDLLSDKLGLIDHAWLFGFPREKAPGEPWGLVIEPYVAEDKAHALAHLANDAMADWQVTTHALPAAESSWSPGRCIPIVSIMGDAAPAFLNAAVSWGLQHLKPRGY